MATETQRMTPIDVERVGECERIGCTNLPTHYHHVDSDIWEAICSAHGSVPPAPRRPKEYGL